MSLKSKVINTKQINISRLTWFLIGIPLALLLLFMRNATYLYHDGYNYLVSIAIGVFLGWAMRKANVFIAIPFFITLIVDFILSAEKYWLEDIAISMTTILAISTLIYAKRFIYAVLCSISYSILVYILMFVIVEKHMAVSFEGEISANQFSIKSMESNETYLLSDVTDGMILLYWHTGCRYCIKMEQLVYQFLKEHPNINIKVLNIEMTGKTDKRTLDMASKHHPYFPHYQDENQVIQKTIGSQAGPVMVIIDQSGLVKHIYMGYNRNLDLMGHVFLKRITQGIQTSSARNHLFF